MDYIHKTDFYGGCWTTWYLEPHPLFWGNSPSPESWLNVGNISHDRKQKGQIIPLPHYLTARMRHNLQAQFFARTLNVKQVTQRLVTENLLLQQPHYWCSNTQLLQSPVPGELIVVSNIQLQKWWVQLWHPGSKTCFGTIVAEIQVPFD